MINTKIIIWLFGACGCNRNNPALLGMLRRTTTGGCYLIQRPTSWPLVQITTFLCAFGCYFLIVQRFSCLPAGSMTPVSLHCARGFCASPVRFSQFFCTPFLLCKTIDIQAVTWVFLRLVIFRK